ncbi:MAG: adenylate kinase [Bradymonadaceae bacterium]
MKTRLIMLGPPGAGKGTQAQRLADDLDVPQVSTGDMLRDARRRGTELGEKAAEYMDAGELVPDEIVVGIVDDRLDEPDARDGYILDGFPRTREQAEALDEMGVSIDAVISLSVGEDELVRRLSGRLNCPECGAAFHADFDPPSTDDVCDECGHEGLVTREDDRPEVVRERLATYREQTEPLVAYYQQKGLLVEIDGEGTPEEVADRIRSVVEGDPA